MNGFILANPEVLINTTKVRADGGNLNFKDTIKEPAVFKDWVFVYSVGKNQQYDDQDAD
jgi:hypothetical protein